MSATKKEIMADLKYCKESLDRIIRYTEKPMRTIHIIVTIQ